MEDQKQKSWFSRNWPWVVPVGGCLTLIIIAAIGIGTVFMKMPDILNNLEPVQYAITEASTNEDLIEAIGQPLRIDPNGQTQGSFDMKNSNSEIDMIFPLEGPKGEAMLYVKGSKENDEWTYEELYIKITHSKEIINLLE